MAPNPRVKAAYTAVKDLGITEEQVKPVLKKLIKLFEKNWEMIEADNYRVLIDAIFDQDDAKVEEQKRKSQAEEEEEDAPTQELERPLKRLRRRNQENETINSADNSNPKLGGAGLLQPKQEEESNLNQIVLDGRNKGKKPISSDMTERGILSKPADKGIIIGRPSNGVRINEANNRFPKQIIPIGCQQLMRPKDEPVIDDRPIEEPPLSMILPGPSPQRTSTVKPKICGEERDEPTSSCGEGQDKGGGLRSLVTEKHFNSNLTDAQTESVANLEIASSSLGEVKLTLSCNSTVGRSGFQMPSLDEVLKAMEEKCLRSYKILDPSFSVTKLMKDICQCFVELGKECNDPGDKRIHAEQVQEVSHKPVEKNSSIADEAQSIPVSSDCRNKSTEVVEEAIANGSAPDEGTQLAQSEGTEPQGTLCVQGLIGEDITNGEETCNIAWINEINHQFPPAFRYTPQSIVYDGASMCFSLSQINEKNCCPSCCADCLSTTVPCTCALANGGEFAYTVKGLVKESFLAECIAMIREPRRVSHFYCQDCPLKRSQGSDILACNGHLKRKFIKECWRKCGCNRRCSNRVVQRGISCGLQVFMTYGKGWGLRTLDDLPKGAFVCEYIGEILTVNEVQKRSAGSIEGGRKGYQVFLDAGWETELVKDDESLCLDTTFYANVARFINHRCNDANLIEIPVEVESPKRRYHHLAFFTTRKVNAMEELTWDYGIDFGGQDKSLKTFECLCGSESCRDKKNSGI